jgi:hypothetical protein
MNRLLAAILFLLAVTAPAWADYSIVQGNGVPAVVKSFSYGGGIGPQNTPVDSTGNPFGTSANPFYITGPGGGVPVTGTFWQATQPISGTVTATQATGSSLHMVCDSGCSSTAPADESAFTAGTTSQTPVGGFYQTSPTSNPLTTGQMGAFQVTAARALFTNTYQLAGTVLGAPSNYGTSPGAVEVPGVNAFITNVPAVSQSGSWAVTANAGTNLNTSALATSANQTTNAAIGSTTSGQTGPLIQGAVTTSSPSYTTAQTDPFSLTTAGALRVDASATTQPVSSSTLATAANQTNANQKTQIVDGSGSIIGSTSNNLDVQCANCSGSGASAADGASFTAGSSTFAPFGGPYQTSATSNPLTAGDQGLAQLTHYRALMTDWFNSSGTEMGTSSSPVQVSLANTGANGTAVAVSAASLPLPTGAATAANQEVTAAGSSASSAQGVQGVTGGVALPVSGTFWQTTQPVSLAGISTLARLVSSAASTNLTAVKSSAATLFKFGACNTTTSPAYVKFYNLASGSVTVGTSAVFLSRELPPDQCSSYDFANGYSFGTAISFAITGGNADSDTTALSAGEIVQAEAAYQ